jgi:putative component of membrane protein insertase Oxa1/YidC/SpoIIIJ protein YidD
MRVRDFALLLLYPFDRGGALLAFIAVAAYRRWLSPRKGFVCAHGAVTGEPSCSAVAAQALRHGTLSSAVPVIRAQFQRCRRSYAAFKSDVFDAANAHLAQFSTLATAGAVGCCGGGKDDGGPLGRLDAPVPVVAKSEVSPPQTPKSA